MPIRSRSPLMAPEGDPAPGGNTTPPAGAPEAWLASLPEDLRGDPSIKDFKTPEALAKAFRDTKALVGSSIRVPGPEASPEARKEYIDKLLKADPNLTYLPVVDPPKEAMDALWSKLGRPGKPEDYTAEGLELAPGKPFDATPLRKLAAEAGLTKAQFQSIAKLAATEEGAKAKALTDGWAALKAEWGLAFEEKLKGVASVAAKVGVPPELVAALNTGAWDPQQVRIWANIAKAIGVEPGEIGGQTGGAPSGKLTPAEAEARIGEVMANKAFFDATHPSHQLLKQKFEELVKMAAGEAP